MARKRQSLFSKKEMMRILGIDVHSKLIYMPNEIFSDLTSTFNEMNERTDEKKTSTHIAFAYAYIYLATYMWRYARYWYWDDSVGNVQILESTIKMLLGFPAKSEQYTYLTKAQTGILEQIGYIRKVSDKPCRSIFLDSELEFVYESEHPELYGNSRNWKSSMPVKGIWRERDSELDCIENGTFFYIGDTHEINIDTFIYCMTHPKLGVEGFYLYCFLRMQYDKFPMGYDCSKKRMAKLTGLSIDEVKSQLENLERCSMITNDHKPWCIDKPDDKETKANTYTVLDYSEFTQNLMQMKIIPKQRKVSAEVYERTIGWANEKEIDDNIVDTNTGEIIRPAKPKFSVDNIDISDLDDLPFDFH